MKTINLSAIHMAILTILVVDYFCGNMESQINEVGEVPEGSDKKYPLKFRDDEELEDFKNELLSAAKNADHEDRWSGIKEILDILNTPAEQPVAEAPVEENQETPAEPEQPKEKKEGEEVK